MKERKVGIADSVGSILCSNIYYPGGKKGLGKGHVITNGDVAWFEIEGLHEVWVVELEDGEVGESDAVMKVTTHMACGCFGIRQDVGGKVKLIATEDCAVLVDSDLLHQINCMSGLAIATSLNFTFAKAGQFIAIVKSTPFAVAKEHLKGALSLLNEKGPLLQARPIRKPVVAVLYTDPVNGERAQQLFQGTMLRRLNEFGVSVDFALTSGEEKTGVLASLQHLLRSKPSCVLIASTTAPAGPSDVIGQAMLMAGCQIERFLAPVEPGSLLLLGYKDDTPIVSAPGCFYSAKTNVLDLLIPPMLARYKMSSWDIASLGHGGLLLD